MQPNLATLVDILGGDAECIGGTVPRRQDRVHGAVGGRWLPVRLSLITIDDEPERSPSHECRHGTSVVELQPAIQCTSPTPVRTSLSTFIAGRLLILVIRQSLDAEPSFRFGSKGEEQPGCLRCRHPNRE